jgi:hypothetical protein
MSPINYLKRNMMCSNFARCQVEGRGYGGNFLMSGTSGKGEILPYRGHKLTFYNYNY